MASEMAARWSVDERRFAVENFIKTKSVVTTQRDFRRHFNNRVAPSGKSIRRWLRKWREDGSVVNKKPTGRTPLVNTDMNKQRVRATVTQSPTRSTRQQAQALGMSDRSVRRVLKSIGFHPYKIQLTQIIQPTDKVARSQMANVLLQRKAQVQGRLLMTDEAHFHLCGAVNKQNCRYWSGANPRLLHERPLHSPKVTVWCGVGDVGIVGPYFFEDENGATVTVNGERYRNMLQTFLQPQLQNFPPLWFQQDGATAHTAGATITMLNQMFPGCLISRRGDVEWAPRSPDLTAPDFFLWGYLKSKVYVTRPHTLQQLKTNIAAEISAIPGEMLRKVMAAFWKRLEECQQCGGGHLKDTIFKC